MTGLLHPPSLILQPPSSLHATTSAHCPAVGMEGYAEHEDIDDEREMAASVRRSSRKRKRPALNPSSSSHTEEEPVVDDTRAFNPTRPIPTPLARSEPQVQIQVEEEERQRDPGTTASLQIEDDTSMSMGVESHGNEQVEEKNKTAQEGEGDEEKNNTCGICFEEVKERGVLDSCRHAFCFDCIHRWSKVANSCPMCKAAFYTITRQHDVAGGELQQEGAAPQEEEEVEQDNPPSKRRRGRKVTSQKKKKPKKKPDVVRVRPKKQQYRYSRREIEDIARAAEAAEASQPHHHHHHPGHRYASASLLNRMLGHPDADALPAASMGFFFGLAGPADNDEDEDEDLDEDEMEGLRSGEEEEGEGEDHDFLLFASGREDRSRQLLASTTSPAPTTARRRTPYQPPRQRQPTAAPHHWESQAGADRQLAGARDRIRSVLESRARMRVDGGRLGPFARYGGRAPWMAPASASLHHPPPTVGGGAALHHAADFHRQQHQHAMAQGLESLKGMFGDSMDAEVLEAVLQQVGGSVERAVDALFAMQGGSGDSPVASSEDSSTSTSTSSATAAAFVDLTTDSSAAAAATPAASSPLLFECLPPTHSTGATARPSRAPAPASAWSSPSSPPETSMSAPIILVPDEDVEFIAERQVKPRRRHLGLQRTATASSSPASADGADYNRPRPSPSSASSATSSPSPSPSPSSPPSLGSVRRFPKFPGRRFCPPRPLSSTTFSASSSPSSSSAPLLPLALPPLVPDDVDRRPDVGHEEGMTLAWRDFAEVQRETKKEHKRKLLEERDQQLSSRPLASASASSSPPPPSSSSGGRPPLPSTGLTRRR